MLSPLIYLFFVSTSVWTLFNPFGTIPLSLIVVITIALNLIVLFLMKPIRRPNIVVEDFLLTAFLITSMLSIALNYKAYNLNLSHFIAELSVIFIYYLCLKFALVNSVYEINQDKLFRVICVTASIIASSGAIDYFFLVQGVNIADILPMEQANKVAGTGIFSRARGFYPEPTDFALALNTFFPLALTYLYTTSKRKLLVLLLLIYVVFLVISRSAAGVAGLLAGLFVAYAVALFSRDIGIARAAMILFAFIALGSMSLASIELIFESFSTDLMSKIFFSK